MRIFIPGIDGYLGWTLAQYLAERGHEVAGCDLYLRRKWVAEMGSQSATPISPMEVRLKAFKERFKKELLFKEGDLRDYNFVTEFFKLFQPEAIVHLGEMPSAPYSMIDINHCAFNASVSEESFNVDYVFCVVIFHCCFPMSESM